MMRHTVLLLMGLALVAGCGSDDQPASQAPQAGDPPVRTVQPQDVAPDVTAGDTLLVDVREPDEWQAGHAPEAMHVPLATVGDRLDEIRAKAAGRPIAFICRSGNRSAQASQIAVDGGLTGVVNVDGGMAAWVGAGLPIEPEDGRIL